MKLGLDSYCYHRFFGETYEGLEAAPEARLSLWEVIERAERFGAEGISVETCFLDREEAELPERIRDRLARSGLDLVWAWGHPQGLGSGARPDAVADALAEIDRARRAGAEVMRICAGGRATRPVEQDWSAHKAALLPVLAPLVERAEAVRVTLAIENHIDLLSWELVDLIETLASPRLKVCLDTANTIRMYEDPRRAVARLAPYAAAVHAKDVLPVGGDPATMGFWPSVPAGQGVIDFAQLFAQLTQYGFEGLLAVEIDYLDPRWCPPGATGGPSPAEDAAVQASLAHLAALRGLSS